MVTARELLIYLSLIYKGKWDDICKAVQEKKRVVPEEVKRMVGTLKYNAVTLLDEGYPQVLMHGNKPPFVLYYKGNLSILKGRHKFLGVIGSRNPTRYGLEQGERILDEAISRNSEFALVSGMAKGIDSAMERVGLRHETDVVSVLGNGIDSCYPKSSSDLYMSNSPHSLILSEYPPGVKPEAENFPFRNRIIAMLSDTLFLVEADERSGSSITLSYALDYGKDIITIPEPLDSKMKLNNLMIRDGAMVALEGRDLLGAMNFQTR